jgi:hypothetical protein
MKTIELHVDDKNYETVMTIVENLKSGLITNIKTDGEKSVRKGRYMPKQGKAIDEREKPAGKYLSASDYRIKLKK